MFFSKGLTGSLTDRRTSLPESARPRLCVGRLATYVRVTSSSPLSRAPSPWAPLDRFRRWCEKRHGAGLLLLRQVSGVKTRSVQRLVISKRNPQHVASLSTCRRRPLLKGFLSAGKLTDSATGIAVYVDEKQLISAGQERIGQKKMKNIDMSVSKLKQQVARSENDARCAAADRNHVPSIE